VRLKKTGKILLSRSIVDWAGRIFVKRLASGRYDERKIKSAALKSAYGAWSAQIGDEFRNEVCDLYKRHEWEVDPEVKSLNNKAVPMEGVGPIDIIAINRSMKRLLVVECKRTNFSRNPKDLKTELEKFFGDKDDIGYIKRLLNKTAWVRDSLEDAAKHYGIPDIATWGIDAVLVSSEYVWAIDAKQPAGLTAYTLDTLAASLRPPAN
jgi:hypothetical protein